MAVPKLNPFAPEYVPIGIGFTRSSSSSDLLDHPHPLFFSAFPSPHQILYPSPPPPPPPAAAFFQFQTPVHGFVLPPPPAAMAAAAAQERGIVSRSADRGRSQQWNSRPSQRREIENNGGYRPAGGRNFVKKRWTPRFNGNNDENDNNNNVRVSEQAPGSDDVVVGGLLKHEVVFLKSEDEKTTVMIKNIPYQYTRDMLLKFVDEHCMYENRKSEENGETDRSAYDFMYLPIDFRSGMNKGYAFVNFTEPRAALKFHHCRNMMPWDLFPESHKRSLIVCARIQGLQALVSHFEKSTFYCEVDEYLPVNFNPPRDGSSDDDGRLKTFIGKRISSDPAIDDAAAAAPDI